MRRPRVRFAVEVLESRTSPTVFAPPLIVLTCPDHPATPGHVDTCIVGANDPNDTPSTW
jgi:hypothetical protein